MIKYQVEKCQKKVTSAYFIFMKLITSFMYVLYEFKKVRIYKPTVSEKEVLFKNVDLKE
jgi:hypothetical protein